MTCSSSRAESQGDSIRGRPTKITDDLVADLDGLTFGPPVTHVYNPLVYARAAWDLYCDKYGRGRKEIILVGMNPGPFGMSDPYEGVGDQRAC